MSIYKNSARNLSIISLLMFLLPAIVSAAENVLGIIAIILAIIKAASGVVVALALLYFLWGMAVLIFNAADSAKRQEGRQRMLWGIIALFVMVSLIGIILILESTFLPNQPRFIELDTLPHCIGQSCPAG